MLLFQNIGELREYIKVLNMSGVDKVLNKTFHDRYLAVFSICLQF